VLSLFRNHTIHCLPVYDDTTVQTNGQNGRYKGIVSIVDILIFLNHSQLQSPSPPPHNLFQQPISQAIGSTKESSNLFLVSRHSPLSTVLNQMCQGQSVMPEMNEKPNFLSGFHRCVVIDSSTPGHSAQLLTQTDLVKYFLDHLDSFPVIEVTPLLSSLCLHHPSLACSEETNRSSLDKGTSSHHFRNRIGVQSS
jgi:hypothetical protein